MQPEERQQKIEAYLQQVEFASLDELSEKVEASASTVRRDLAILEATGTVRRTHGGARILSPRSDEFAFSSRDTQQLAEKEAIGKLTAELIEPNQSLIIDAGTTAFHVSRYLDPKTPHIITNSLPVANHFASNNRIEVIVSGGVIYPRLGVLVGPLAVEAFRQLRAETAIMSAGGITLDGVSNSHALLIDIQRAMIDAARRVILCLDHTKLGRQSVTPLCPLNAIDTLVTDDKAPVDLVDALRQRGVNVLVASPHKT